MTKSSWGYLGKPPKSVIEGSQMTMYIYKRFLKDVEKAEKLPHKQRSVKLAEIKARFDCVFPPEKDDA